jgi:branched-chain amino acid transport system substrate-binding protein
MASGSTLAAAPEIKRRKIPMVSPASTNPKVTEVGDYIFRTCFIDPYQGDQMGKFAVETLKLKKFAILKDVKSDYSMGLAQNFTATVKRLGGEIVAEEAYSAGDVEFRSQLTSIKAKNPDGIFIPGYYTEIGLIARQARGLGLSLPLLGGDGWDSPKTIEIGGSDVNNSYFSTAFVAADPDPNVKAFIKRFEDRYHHVPSGMAVMGYEAARLVMDAITRAGSTAPAKIRDALAATRDFVSVTGKMTVGPDRNMRKRLVIVKISDGKPDFFVAINP